MDMGSKAVFDGYVYQTPKNNWTAESEIKKKMTKVDLQKDEDLESGGIPVISDGNTLYLDTSDSHLMIYGASGFKKSLTVFMPLIAILAKAAENMVITDPKGELYTRTAKYLTERGYDLKVLNFRDYDGDGYNPLHYPTKLYRSGEKDKAAAAISYIIEELAGRQTENLKVDPFWPDTAKAFNNGVIPLIIDSYPDKRHINFLSLADYYTEKTADQLANYINKYYGQYRTINTALTNILTVLSEPEKTRMSTLATCSSFIQPFLQNDKLLRMLSHSTFDIEDIYKEKTAIFIITDDTSTLCNPIIEILISQLQTVAVDKAFHSPKGKLQHRLNFLLDEFCSYSIKDFNEALATHRSRNIRYFLCVQSLDLLNKKYPHYKSLLANCATTLFLGSTEQELLKEISERCGTTNITANGNSEPLISVPELMTLKKAWYSKEMIYLNLAENIRYVTTLPTIEKYEEFCLGDTAIPVKHHPLVRIYTFEKLIRDISRNKTKLPFEYLLKKETEEEHKKRLNREPEEKFDELFGSDEED